MTLKVDVNIVHDFGPIYPDKNQDPYMGTKCSKQCYMYNEIDEGSGGFWCSLELGITVGENLIPGPNCKPGHYTSLS